MRTFNICSICSFISVSLVSVAVCLLLACVGCSTSEPTEKPAQTKASPSKAVEKQAAEKPEPRPKKSRKAAPKVEEPPPKPTIPKVSLTAVQRATCLVQVGDLLPEAALPDLEGKTQDLKSLYGEKLTVVCFWGVQDSKFTEAVAVDMLQSLDQEFAAPYADKGVHVIGVSVEGQPEVVGQLVAKAGARFAELLDRDKAFFAKVATEKMPRVYLLDAAGKILWFDVEYSRSTRREMLQGIRVALGEI
jgi:hypothetical protein